MNLERELGASRFRDKKRLIELIYKYFGEEDGRLVLEIALFFKQPGCYQWLAPKLIKKLEEACHEDKMDHLRNSR